MDFLDHCISHPSSYIVNFRKSVEEIDRMGYSKCLGYFIAISIDSSAWLPKQFAEKLSIDEGTVLDIYQAYSQPINDAPIYYIGPVETYYESVNDFDVISKDLWKGSLRGAW